MALALVVEQGDQYAQGLQLAIEYDPDPPFDCGSPGKAPEDVLAMIKAFMDDTSRRQLEAR